jgi:hypothetical protein
LFDLDFSPENGGLVEASRPDNTKIENITIFFKIDVAGKRRLIYIQCNTPPPVFKPGCYADLGHRFSISDGSYLGKRDFHERVSGDRSFSGPLSLNG